jgi:hypothetical protein
MGRNCDINWRTGDSGDHGYEMHSLGDRIGDVEDLLRKQFASLHFDAVVKR